MHDLGKEELTTLAENIVKGLVWMSTSIVKIVGADTLLQYCKWIEMRDQLGNQFVNILVFMMLILLVLRDLVTIFSLKNIILLQVIANVYVVV